MIWVGTLVWTLFGLINVVSAQTCEKFNVQVTPYLNNVLPSTYDVFLPPGYQQVNISSQLKTLPLMLSGITDTTCRNLAASLIAMSFYRPCSTSTNLPQPLCQSQCLDVISACNGQVNSAGIPALQLIGALGVRLNCSDSNVYPTTNCVAPPVSNATVSYARCVPFDPTVASTFATLIPAKQPIWVNFDSSLNCLEDQAKSLSTLLAIIRSDTCRNTFSALFAARIFMRCEVSANTGGLSLPQLPCQDSCTNTVSACQNELPIISTVLQMLSPVKFDQNSCTARTNSFGVDDFPVSNSTFASQPLPLSTTCQRITPAVPFYPRCEAYRGSVCAGVLGNYSIYVPAGMTQEALEKMIAPRAFLFNIAPVATGCLDSMAEYFCLSAFQRCEAVPVAGFPISVPLPRLPCQSVCTRFSASCDPLFRAIPSLGSQLRPNCSARGSFFGKKTNCLTGIVTDQGAPDFPTTNTMFLPQLGLATNCYSRQDANETIRVQAIKCPAPLVRPDSPTNTILGGSCAVPCWTTNFTPDEIVTGAWIVFGMEIVSLCTSIFMFLTWFLFKRSKMYILSFSFCVMAISLVLSPHLSKNMNDPADVFNCRNNVQGTSLTDNSFCGPQAVLLIYFVNAAITWWCVQAVELFAAIVLQFTTTDPKTERLKNIVYHCIAWFWPAIAVIVVSVKKSVGSTSQSQWCWFNDNATTDIYLMYVPMAVEGAIAVFCMACIIYKLLRSAYATGMNLKAGWWRVHVRPVVFISVFLFLFFFVFLYRFYNDGANLDRFKASAVDWFTCLLITGPATGVSCGPTPKERSPVGLWYMLLLCTAGQGFLNFLLYGTMKDNFTFWYDFIFSKSSSSNNEPSQSSSGSGLRRAKTLPMSGASVNSSA